MTIRVDSASLIAGKTVVSLYAGHGILASQIPSGGYLFNDISNAADEMRGEILTWPSAGTLSVNEDSSFSFTGAPDGEYSFTYRGYKNGVAYGDYTVTLAIGAGNFSETIAKRNLSVVGKQLGLSISPSLTLTKSSLVYSGKPLSLTTSTSSDFVGQVSLRGLVATGKTLGLTTSSASSFTETLNRTTLVYRGKQLSLARAVMFPINPKRVFFIEDK
jgi:hypothetical protein